VQATVSRLPAAQIYCAFSTRMRSSAEINMSRARIGDLSGTYRKSERSSARQVQRKTHREALHERSDSIGDGRRPPDQERSTCRGDCTVTISALDPKAACSTQIVLGRGGKSELAPWRQGIQWFAVTRKELARLSSGCRIAVSTSDKIGKSRYNQACR